MNSILCNLFITCVVNIQAVTPLEELSYGTVLYEYHQGHYEAGLLQVLLAEAQNRTGDDSARFRIAGGSFAFANGMFRYAQNTFEDLDSGQLSNLDRQRLSFHLAREYFRRQDWDKLTPQLAQIDLDRNWFGRQQVHPEVEFMRAELAIHNGLLKEAQAILETIPKDNPLRIYGLFNLGVAYYHKATDSNASFDAAFGVFKMLSQISASDAETLDIIQRSRLALARIKTQVSGQQLPPSDELLDILPGTGRYRNLALASYATMAMQAQDPHTASRIWQMLKQEKFWTTSSANAYLGLPMSLEALSSEGFVPREAVLHAFRDAENRFESRLDTLQRISEQAEDNAWMGDFLTTFADPQSDRTARSEALEQWREEIGYVDWLEWLSSESVNGLLSDWSELKRMSEYLVTIPDNLVALDGAAREIKRRATAAGSLLRREQGVVRKRELLSEQIAQLRARIIALESAPVEFSEEWMLSIASGDQIVHTQRYFEMLELANDEPDEENKAAIYRRIERLRGLLFFELGEGKSTRLQSLRTTLKSSDRQMANIDEAQVRLRQAEEKFDTGVAIAFSGFEKRAEDLDQAVSKALRNRQELLAREIRSGMQREIQRVEQFLLVARIAIARTTDLLAMQYGADSR